MQKLPGGDGGGMCGGGAGGCNVDRSFMGTAGTDKIITVVFSLRTWQRKEASKGNLFSA